MSSEKTEQPTQKRLRDARNKGQVAHSKEVSSTALLLGVFAYFVFYSDWIYQQLVALVVLPAAYHGVPFEQALPHVAAGVIGKVILLSAPPVGVVIILGVVANYLQVGSIFSVEPITPKLSKLNPAEKLKQMFSLKNFIEFVKSVIKVVFLGVLIYYLIRNAIPALVYVPYDGLDGVLRILNVLLFRLAMYTAFAYIVIAVFDYVFQVKQHTKQLMMTKQEVKQEHKDNEGDPTIKKRRRQIHRELATDEAVKRVKKSTVLVTNPTHYAIALRYEKGVTRLPVLLAKGHGALAQRMIDAAHRFDVPIVRNVPLAHDLYDNGYIERFIPRDLIEPVAEVLRAVIRLREEQR